MRYWGPYNSPGGIYGDDPYQDGDADTGQQGSIPTFRTFEQMMRELQHLVVKSGLTPSDLVDDVQIAQAVQSGKVKYGLDTGTADSMIVTLDPRPVAYIAGMHLLFKKGAAANATTTPTVAFTPLAARPLVNRRGGALAPGDLAADSLVLVVDDGANFRVLSFVPSEVNEIVSLAGRIQTYTANANFIVPPGITSVVVECWGAGGGGGGTSDGSGGASPSGTAGGGGGAGGFCLKKISGLVPGTSIPVTVGAGGAAPLNDNGLPGGTTSFGSHCSATGGAGGGKGHNNLNPGGVGGIGVNGDFIIDGGNGGPGMPATPGFLPDYLLYIFNKGGNPPYMIGVADWSGTGPNGVGYCMGGNGGSGGVGNNGNPGSPGILVVRW